MTGETHWALSLGHSIHCCVEDRFVLDRLVFGTRKRKQCRKPSVTQYNSKKKKKKKKRKKKKKKILDFVLHYLILSSNILAIPTRNSLWACAENYRLQRFGSFMHWVKMDKVERKTNFTDKEIYFILEQRNIKILLSQLCNTITNKTKKDLWKKIATEVSALSGIRREEDEVKKKWHVGVSV